MPLYLELKKKKYEVDPKVQNCFEVQKAKKKGEI
jgi:hypothetical protein